VEKCGGKACLHGCLIGYGYVYEDKLKEVFKELKEEVLGGIEEVSEKTKNEHVREELVELSDEVEESINETCYRLHIYFEDLFEQIFDIFRERR